MTPFELAVLAMILSVVSATLFFIINIKVNGMREVLRDYCDRANAKLAEPRAVQITPPAELIQKWRYELAKADKGSVRWQAYHSKLKEFDLLNDGD